MQHLGVELLLLADGWALQEEAGEPVASQRPAEVSENEPVRDLDPGQNWDYSEVSWEPDGTADDWERMQAAMAVSSHVTVRSPAAPEEPPAPVDADFDREWT